MFTRPGSPPRNGSPATRRKLVDGFGGQAAAEDAKIPEILEQGMFIKLSGGSPPQ